MHEDDNPHQRQQRLFELLIIASWLLAKTKNVTLVEPVDDDEID